ncbi:hypothetical protein [Bradyrhizobium sp. 1]|uniref:DUF6894 family protein n=1 Tax=Bradyrhizobium sp. 1 TaxID=241591 RepID=UPI001FFABC02|nr:hypothetical protein [Bradyrhizobium sp. 1]MCK1394998.1 hypothetical protein [Bradyrhizobium sp. 1]
MPRFFFVVVDGRNMEVQNDGLELPDRDAAWVEATTACGELLRDLDGKLKPGDQWCMKVRDASATDIYLLEFKTRAV